MFPQTGRTVLSGLLFLALICPQRIFAWGAAGHEAVAYVAWQQMKPAVRSRAVRCRIGIRAMMSVHAQACYERFKENVALAARIPN